MWAPGVSTRAGAFHHVDDVVLSLLADAPAPRVVDLGCGVGGSLVHLAAHRADLVGDGITISPAQVAAAGTLIARALELRRPRDRALALLVAAARPLPLRGEYWRSLVGGDALQRCLGSGLLAYRLLVLRRVGG